MGHGLLNEFDNIKKFCLECTTHYSIYFFHFRTKKNARAKLARPQLINVRH